MTDYQVIDEPVEGNHASDSGYYIRPKVLTNYQ
jgi:hypothetical protein